ncbi:MAG: hypothetical protein ACXVAD_11635, partial [Syntrophales bacterium]
MKDAPEAEAKAKLRPLYHPSLFVKYDATRGWPFNHKSGEAIVMIKITISVLAAATEQKKRRLTRAIRPKAP